MVYVVCFRWILDIWDLIGVKNNNSYDPVFYFSLVVSKLAFSNLVEKQSPNSIAGMPFSSETKSHTPLRQVVNDEIKEEKVKKPSSFKRQA